MTLKGLQLLNEFTHFLNSLIFCLNLIPQLLLHLQVLFLQFGLDFYEPIVVLEHHLLNFLSFQLLHPQLLRFYII